MSDDERNTVEEPPEESQEEEAAEEGPRATVERTGPCECVIRMEADADYLRDRYQQELESLKADVKLAGFRRGRAPIGLVERRLGGSLRSDLISSVVSEAYEGAVDEHQLTVVAETEAPDLENFKWEPGQPAQFEFKCEVLPEIELEEAHYKGLEVEVPALAVTEELLQNELERFAQQFATWEEVAGAGIDWDDYVEAQVSVPEQADWSETIGFYPRAERVGPFSVEGIKAALIGAKAGEEVELEAQVLADQASGRPNLEPLAGQKVKLHLRLERVMRRKVPELNGELAKKIGLSSAEEIEPLVRERLDNALSQRRDEIARQMLVRRVLENVTCEMPPSLIERAAEEEQVRVLVRLLRQGVARQEAERRADQSAGQTREAVVRRLKAAYLLRLVAERERVLVTESEVDGQIRSFAAGQGWREERARTYMEEKGMVRALRDDMRETKTLDLLMENAELKDLPPDEFAARYGREGDVQEQPAAPAEQQQ